MNTVTERLAALRKVMEEKNIDVVIVPTGDPHMSEYECDHYRCRTYITGFTGSDGTAVIFRDENLVSGLWTDSRYFIQAEQQLKGSGNQLFKIGIPGTPRIVSHIIDQLPSPDSTVACDGRVVNFDTFAAWYDTLADEGIELLDDVDLVGEIWEDRPPLPKNPVYEYDLKYAGKPRAEKLKEIRAKVMDYGAEVFLLTKADDISWLLNIRGSDIHCTPVPLCYFILYADRGRLFINEDSLPADLKHALGADGITVEPYDSITQAVRNLEAGSVLLSTLDTNSNLYTNLPESVYIIEDSNPTQLAKAIKNPVEIDNARKAHFKDAIAMTKFIYWLKQNVNRSSSIGDNAHNQITEMSAAEKLYELRSQQENYTGNSFDPIIAYADHGAIVHYMATEETDAPLQPKGLLLMDTGGQYLEGTTDITRTIALGPITDEEREMSTRVLKGHIALASAIFPRGLNGANLDILAHAPLWEVGKDYGHGTGHGVGHFLSVHEGPNNIHWTRNGAIGTTPAFEAGMITSCEPGYYEAGKFGIRHESLILCKSVSRGQAFCSAPYLCFEELTLVPFDPDAIDLTMLTSREREWLKNYHETIYEKIAPHLSDEERAWLKYTTDIY